MTEKASHDAPTIKPVKESRKDQPGEGVVIDRRVYNPMGGKRTETVLRPGTGWVTETEKTVDENAA